MLLLGPSIGKMMKPVYDLTISDGNSGTFSREITRNRWCEKGKVDLEVSRLLASSLQSGL